MEEMKSMRAMKNMGKVYNCIVVFNKEKDAALFCMRKNEPYKERYNFVGGKVEPGEESEAAAYRELQEETGISRQQIRLFRLMDIRYYHQNFDLELYVGQLENDVVLKEEKNPLFWLSLDEDFADKDKFAGEQNIAHIMNVALQYPIPRRTFTQDGLYIGADGCEGLKNQTLHPRKEEALEEADYYAKASSRRMSYDEVFSGLRQQLNEQK